MPPISQLKKAITLNYVQVICNVVEACGGNKEQLLHRAGIESTGLNQFFEFISLSQYQRLLEAAVEMTGDPGIGLQIGQGLKFGTHGTFAFAALSFPTAWDAMKAGQKFSLICNRIVSIDMVEEDAYHIIRVDTPYFAGPLYQTVMEIVLGSFCEIFYLKFDQGLEKIQIDFRYGEPPYGEQYRKLIRPVVNFEAESNEIRIPKPMAEQKLAMASPSVAARFNKECDELLASMEHRADIVDQVRQQLVICKPGFPTLEELATRLNMSSRTLRRRLQERDTSFKQILDSVRLELATRYLLTTSRRVGEIAHILGYEDQNSFSHAFKVLTGIPPTQYRKTHEGNLAPGTN